MTEEETKLAEEVKGYVKKYEEAMEDDFNTADAIAAIFELVKLPYPWKCRKYQGFCTVSL